MFCLIVHTYSGGAGGRTPVHASACTTLWDLVLCLQGVKSGKELPGLYLLVFIVYSIHAESLNIESEVLFRIKHNLDQRGTGYPSQVQMIILHLPGSRLSGVTSPYTVPSWPECSCMFEELLNPLLWFRGWIYHQPQCCPPQWR